MPSYHRNRPLKDTPKDHMKNKRENSRFIYWQETSMAMDSPYRQTKYRCYDIKTNTIR